MPNWYDIILLCIGEEKHMSGENGTRSTLKLHNEHLVDEYAKFGKNNSCYEATSYFISGY